MRKFLVGALLSLCAATAFGQAQVMRCDPNATGSAQYPNVVCDSSGHLIVSSSASTGNTAVVGPTASGSTFNTNPVVVGGVATSGSVQLLRAANSGSLTVASANGTLTDCSGTITTAGTSQVVLGVNVNRRYLLIQNQSAGPEYINFTSAATVGGGSIEIAAAGSFMMENGLVSTEAINIIGATIAQVFTCKYQ